MFNFMLAAAAAYVLLAGAEFTAQYFGGPKRPWARLRYLLGAASLIVLGYSAGNWTGIIPAEASRQEFVAMEARMAPSGPDWLSAAAPLAPPLAQAEKKFEPLRRYPKDFSQVGGQHPDILWYIHYYSELHRVDPLLVRAIIRVESAFKPFAVSHKGAMGLMQINRITARHLGLRNPLDIRENIEGGTRYLKMLLERYYWDIHRALASYNAGPGAVDRFGGIPPYRETRRYVWKVLAEYRKLKRLAKVFRTTKRAPRLRAVSQPREPQARKARSGQAEG
jgi:soluble lytic murein transglycosylase-like protein